MGKLAVTTENIATPTLALVCVREPVHSLVIREPGHQEQYCGSTAPDGGVAGRPSPWSCKTAVGAGSPRRPGTNPNSHLGFKARICKDGRPRLYAL
jgi:hypothetical protein